MAEPSPAVRRRGRPYRLPADPTAVHEPTSSVEHRLAWLLGVSRLHAADPDLARRTTFMAHLEGLGVVVDPARMSRWESGRVKVAPNIVSAYEEVLGLGRGRLSTVAQALDPTSTGRARPAPRDPVVVHAELDEHFERVFGPGADGGTWMRLATLLASRPHPYLLSDTWSKVTELLGSEVVRSTGGGQQQRMEALRVLLRHPMSSRFAVRAIGTVVINPAASLLRHPLTLLADVEDPKVTRLLHKTLAGPPGHDRSGAAWAIARRVLRSDVSAGELNHHSSVAIDILKGSTTLLERMDALTVYAAMPASARLAFSRAGLDPESRNLLDQVRQHGDVLPPQGTVATINSIAETAQQATPITYVVEKDQMLHRLVREALFHAGHDRRQQAAMLLAASPYRAALVPPMLALATQGDETVGVLAMTALHYLVDHPQCELLLESGLADSRPGVRTAALTALTQVVGPLDEADSVRLLGALSQPERGPAEARSLLHVLGMGQARALAQLASSDGPHAASAQWWLDHPPVRDGWPQAG